MVIALNDYEILKKCQGNGVNKIFVVRHKINKEYFIIKIIKLEDERQVREIKIHRKLNFKYVVNMLDYTIKEDYIIMLIEYARYGDLFTFLHRTKNLNKKKIIKLYYKIIQAIYYLHHKKLVHRDIKPENIMITKNFRPKLGDFGTTVDYKQIKNTFCGTYEYMAPEIYLRCKQTEKVDIWALGVLIYEMTEGGTPFKNKTVQEIKKILEEKKIKFKYDIKYLQEFVYDVLQFNPKDRPSCKELLEHKFFDCIKKNKDEKEKSFTDIKNQKVKKNFLTNNQRKNLKKGHLKKQNASCVFKQKTFLNQNLSSKIKNIDFKSNSKKFIGSLNFDLDKKNKMQNLVSIQDLDKEDEIIEEVFNNQFTIKSLVSIENK